MMGVLFLLPSRLQEGLGEGLSLSLRGRTAPPLAPPASGRGIYIAPADGMTGNGRILCAC